MPCRGEFIRLRKSYFIWHALYKAAEAAPAGLRAWVVGKNRVNGEAYLPQAIQRSFDFDSAVLLCFTCATSPNLVVMVWKVFKFVILHPFYCVIPVTNIVIPAVFLAGILCRWGLWSIFIIYLQSVISVAFPIVVVPYFGVRINRSACADQYWHLKISWLLKVYPEINIKLMMINRALKLPRAGEETFFWEF